MQHWDRDTSEHISLHYHRGTIQKAPVVIMYRGLIFSLVQCICALHLPLKLSPRSPTLPAEQVTLLQLLTTQHQPSPRPPATAPLSTNPVILAEGKVKLPFHMTCSGQTRVGCYFLTSLTSRFLQINCLITTSCIMPCVEVSNSWGCPAAALSLLWAPAALGETLNTSKVGLVCPGVISAVGSTIL